MTCRTPLERSKSCWMMRAELTKILLEEKVRCRGVPSREVRIVPLG